MRAAEHWIRLETRHHSRRTLPVIDRISQQQKQQQWRLAIEALQLEVVFDHGVLTFGGRGIHTNIMCVGRW